MPVSTADYEQMLTDADRRLLDEATGAEQRGDLRHALKCLQHVPRPAENSWERDLTEMIELGHAPEPWRWARVTIAAASRWVRSLHVPLVARVLREVRTAAEGCRGPAHPEYPGWVAGQSAVPTAVAGTLLFDELLLEVFLVQVAPVLAGRCGGGRTWAQTRASAYELIDVEGIDLRVRDHADGTTRTVRHLGETVGLSRNDLVYGHIIDVTGEPGSMFAMPPIVVDEVVAQRLDRMHGQGLDDLEGRCEVLGAAVRSGPPYRRGRAGSGDERGAGVRELTGRGPLRDVAEQHGRGEVKSLANQFTPAAGDAS